ncbi:MAG: Beta-galactosidase [Lachnoclostridium sp.]|jgi:beta-galactosidase
MENILQGNKITLGVCYYPEHWDESLWEEDLLRMKECGLEVIRIAEFAWSKIEPREGEFTYEFFDRFLEVAKKAGTKVIFCTPTATPPAWLTEKYPEVLNATIDGVLYRHGARRHYNYNSPKYQELSRRIVEKSASHYAGHPNIIGWQIDNEINCELDVFYSESDTLAFRKFLQKKYGSLEELNKAWGTVFWNQTYTSWEEIYVPRTTVSYTTNPHLMIDYIRFISDSACNFVKMQSDIIKKYKKPGDFITTNGIFSNLDSIRMTEESLDFIMYDSYPNFAYCLDMDYMKNPEMKDRRWSKNLTEVRAISPVFGIMEQQSGANGWTSNMIAPTPRPGQMTLWTMQSIAHGADYVSYFRWRTATMGTEMYWHGILDYSGRDNRRLAEVKEIHKKIQALKEVAGSRYCAEVGIIKDYDNEWDAKLDVWHKQIEELSQEGLFTALQKKHTPFDYCFIDHMTAWDLMKYKVLFYPHAAMVSQDTADKLKKYVEEGGCLIFGCRTGYKDTTGKCVMQKLPGLLQNLSGTDITEYSFVAPDESKVYADWDGTAIEMELFNDLLSPLTESAKVEACYSNSYYKGTPGLISNTYGKGKVYYFGAAFGEQAAGVFLDKLKLSEPYSDIISVPEDCEIAVRAKQGQKYLFVLNYTKEERNITLHKEVTDLYTGEKQSGVQCLKPYGTRVYKL